MDQQREPRRRSDYGQAGSPTFAAKWSSASIARRCVFTAFSALGGVHASFGRHAHEFAFGNVRLIFRYDSVADRASPLYQ